MKGYIQELREVLGSRPLILPGTAVLVINSGRLLLMHRADTGGWGLPGGFMEPGESFEAAGRREVREETGLDLVDMTFLGVFSGAEYFFEYPNGDQVFNVTVAYIARPSGALVMDHSEANDLRYFDVDALPGDLLELERPIVDLYRQKMDGRNASLPYGHRSLRFVVKCLMQALEATDPVRVTWPGSVDPMSRRRDIGGSCTVTFLVPALVTHDLGACCSGVPAWLIS